MTARLRMILPPIEAVAPLAFCFLLNQGCRFYAEWNLGAPVGPDHVVARLNNLLLTFAGLGYGVFRVVGFHPFYRPGYRTWLERTPWTSRTPLPFGPVSLVWEDGFALATLALLSRVTPGSDPARTLALVLFAYIALLALTMAPTGEQAYAYLLAFGLGLVVRLSPHAETALAAGMVVYAAGYVGLRRSLARFPWHVEWQDNLSANSLEQALQRKSEQPCGWPYDQLRPRAEPRVRVGLLDALLISMLVGWWLFAAEALFTSPREALGLFAMVVPTGTFLAALSRLVGYAQGHAPPLTLWGRLRTFRWIIPNYDQVFVGPLLTLVMAPLSIVLFYWMGLRANAFLPITSALVLFTALAAPPRLRRWKLTGSHRIVPAITNQKDFIKVG